LSSADLNDAEDDISEGEIFEVRTSTQNRGMTDPCNKLASRPLNQVQSPPTEIVNFRNKGS